MQVRRVVTDHNAEGLAIVGNDTVMEGERHVDVWSTDVAPCSNLDPRDGSDLKRANGGTGLRIGIIEPGSPGRMHRTKSLDYAIVMSGEIDMEMDGGETVHLKAGDVLIQRGTNHSWINNGTEAAKVAWILVDAEPLVINGKTLETIA